jgi:hypothetical protein
MSGHVARKGEIDERIEFRSETLKGREILED